MSAHKRPHADELIVLDDDDDEDASPSAAASSSIAPLLTRIDDAQPATDSSTITPKRARLASAFAGATLSPATHTNPTTTTTSSASASASIPSAPVTPMPPLTPTSARTPSSSLATPKRLPPVPSPSPPPVVSSHTFTGLYQPHRFITDDAEENKYVIAAAYVLSVTLKWNDSNTSATLQGRISWRYGLMWLNWEALADDRETLFWDVARQSELVNGQAQRVHERAAGGRAEERLRLVMSTRELLPIDVSMSQFFDEEDTVNRDETANQVAYTLQQFERQRRYMLDVQHGTQLTGTITLQVQPTFGDRKEGAEEEEEEEEGRETRVVGWACDESEADTDNELRPVQRMHNEFVARMLDLLTAQQVTADVVGKLRGMLDRVLREPEVEHGKFRRINSTTIAHKFGSAVVDVLKLCGWIEEEMEHQGQRYIVLADDADLLLVATMRRALPS